MTRVYASVTLTLYGTYGESLVSAAFSPDLCARRFAQWTTGGAEKIAADIGNRIITGKLTDLPPVMDLMAEWKTREGTVRNAYALLESLGVLEKRHPWIHSASPEFIISENVTAYLKRQSSESQP